MDKNEMVRMALEALSKVNSDTTVIKESREILFSGHEMIELRMRLTDSTIITIMMTKELQK